MDILAWDYLKHRRHRVMDGRRRSVTDSCPAPENWCLFWILFPLRAYHCNMNDHAAFDYYIIGGKMN